MMLEVLAYVAEGWKPLYLIDVKKFDKEDNTIPIDGYAEISTDMYQVGHTGDLEISDHTVHEMDYQNSINRDFIIRAKRLKGDEWKLMKYKMYRIDE